MNLSLCSSNHALESTEEKIALDIKNSESIIVNDLGLPKPKIVKAVRLKTTRQHKPSTTTHQTPLLIQVDNSQLSLKKQIVQKSYKKHEQIKVYFRNNIP
jgi:D-ribose pyranose/furanose isomerase RbsD